MIKKSEVALSTITQGKNTGKDEIQLCLSDNNWINKVICGILEGNIILVYLWDGGIANQSMALFVKAYRANIILDIYQP